MSNTDTIAVFVCDRRELASMLCSSRHQSGRNAINVSDCDSYLVVESDEGRGINISPPGCSSKTVPCLNVRTLIEGLSIFAKYRDSKRIVCPINGPEIVEILTKAFEKFDLRMDVEEIVYDSGSAEWPAELR